MEEVKKSSRFQVSSFKSKKNENGERRLVKIFYPYWAGGSKWEELRYSLRSLEKNFKEDFVVYVVGDCPEFLRQAQEPTDGLKDRRTESSKFQVSSSKLEDNKHGAWSIEHGEKSTERGELIHIPYRRDDSRSALWNTSRMMEVFMNEIQDSRHKTQDTRCSTQGDDLFVRMNDDIYLIGERTLEDLMVTRIVRNPEEVKLMTSGGSIWKRQVMNTYMALTERDYLGYITETHCPEVYSTRNLQLIYQAYELPESELLPSTLYFNVFPFDRMVLDRKLERALFYGLEDTFSNSSEHIENKCIGRYFLNHNDEGLTNELKRFIIEMFPEKSRWEK